MLAVHRNRLHNVPLPTPPQRPPGTPDQSVPLWISDSEPQAKEPEPEPEPEPAAAKAEAPDTTDDTDVDSDTDTMEVPPHEHELPPHEHAEYKSMAEKAEKASLEAQGLADKTTNEFTLLKLAIAQLDKKIKEKDTEITVLQEMLDRLTKKEVENELASSTSVVVFDPEVGRIIGMTLLYRKKGVPVETLVKNLVENWQKDGKDLEFSGVPPNMSVKVKGDASGKGFDFYPSTMMFLRMSKKDRDSLGKDIELVGEKQE
jgi:hypothetical protein